MKYIDNRLSANIIRLEDKNNNYTSENVEGALEEIDSKIKAIESHGYDDTQIKQDINNIKTEIGTEELTTNTKNIKGSVNELNSQIKDVKDGKSDYIVIHPKENTNITSLIINAFNNYNKVKIKKGEYMIDTIRLPKSNIILEGEEGTILTLTSMQGVYGANLENIKILNIKFNGNSILDENNIENGCSAIYLHNTNNINIENVETNNTGAWGIVVTGTSSNISIENCICNGSIRQSGIALSGGCSDFNIRNNICKNNKYAGIITEPNITNGHIVNNTCINNDNNGIIIVGCNNSNITVSNNIINDVVGNAITIINSSHVYVFNNNINGNKKSRYGVYSFGCKNITFNSNLIQNINKSGFYILHENGSNELYDIIFTNNLVINSCLSATEDHESSYFIRDCKNLIFLNNISKSSKKDYCINNNEYYFVDVLKNSNSSEPSYLKPNSKSINFKFKIDTPITFKAPYDMYLYGVNMSRHIVGIAPEGNASYTVLKIDDVDWIASESEFNYEVGQYAFECIGQYKFIQKDSVVKFSYAHSYNQTYVDNIEIELLYY